MAAVGLLNIAKRPRALARAKRRADGSSVLSRLPRRTSSAASTNSVACRSLRPVAHATGSATIGCSANTVAPRAAAGVDGMSRRSSRYTSTRLRRCSRRLVVWNAIGSKPKSACSSDQPSTVAGAG